MSGNIESSELQAMAKTVLAKLGGFFYVDEGIVETFHRICKESIEIPADTVIAAQDGPYSDVLLIDNGWVMRTRHMPNGGRQIVNMAVPGDFVGLNALLFERSDFELRAKTPVTAFKFAAEDLSREFMAHAQLAAALFWANAQEECLLAERIVSLGRRSARQRLAHVLCEFIKRLEIIGVEDTERLIIPISQDEMADILGISVVHTNKTLRSMERDEILSFRNNILMVNDADRLNLEAGFDAGYMHFTQRKDLLARPTILAPAE